MEFKPKLGETRWDPSIEEEILELWEKEQTYKFNENTNKPIYSIDTPPPYASGKWHLGGAIHYGQIDMIARFRRMQGYEVLFPFGIDRNGLPIEVEAEKMFNVRFFEVPREKFIELCKKLLDEYEKDIIWIARRMGLSCNSFDDKDIYRTDSPEYRRITQATFIEYWKKGLIYEAVRPNNWCPTCRTTIADAEVEYAEEETLLVYIKFKVKETGQDLIIATTRPELLCACGCVIVHPDDDRYKQLHGKTAIVPIYNLEVPIIPHKEANPKFGTGAMMVCSFGDYTDVRLYRELKLKPITAISPDGTMTEVAGKYKGLPVKRAREEIIKDLEKLGLVVKKEKIIHRIPICWRSKDPIEFIIMPEYYLKQVEFLPELKKIVDEIKFFPPESKQLLLNWINAVTTDWPISRRRYYGTEIPLWYCLECGKAVVPPPGKYYQPWREPPPFDKCPHCGSKKGFRGEERTFDTWFDSGISNLQILRYLRDQKFFERTFPCSLRPQGKDIVRTWLYYTILRSYLLLKAPAFREVWISGMVLDEKGEKMSKSKGNIIWPRPLIEKYGADAMRLWSSMEAGLGSDIRFSEQRLQGAFKFLVKLWNIARFISAFPIPEERFTLLPADRWILGELNKLIKEAKKGYEALNFQIPANVIRSFVWETFASHYIELVKSRAYNRDGTFSEEEQRGAWYALHTALKTILKLLAPITPFITEKIYRTLYSPNKSIHLERFPEPTKEWETDLTNVTPILLKANSCVWKLKKSKKISLRASISELWLPKDLKPFEKDLKEMHKARSINFGTPPTTEGMISESFQVGGKEYTVYLKI
ncbi:MAG: valine--tRNA ligase [Candidatus Baldrarchaeia archaeon]